MFYGILTKKQPSILTDCGCKLLNLIKTNIVFSRHVSNPFALARAGM